MPLDPEHASQQPAPLFNPAIHITAGRLRANKLHVPPEIPDRAWIAKSDVIPKTMSREIQGRPTLYLGAEFRSEFMISDPGGVPDEEWDPIHGASRAAARQSQGAIIVGPKGEALKDVRR